MRLFDSHAHIQGSEYAGDLGDVMARAREAGVERVLLPSDDLEMARAGIALAGRYEGLYASAGIHPHNASSWDEAVRADLEALLSREKVVALVRERPGITKAELKDAAGRSSAGVAQNLRRMLERGEVREEALPSGSTACC